MTVLDDRETAVSWLDAVKAAYEAVTGLAEPIRAAVDSGEFDSEDGGVVGLDLFADLDAYAAKIAEARAMVERRISEKHVRPRADGWRGKTKKVPELGLTATFTEKTTATVHLPLVARLAAPFVGRPVVDERTGETVQVPAPVVEVLLTRMFDFLQSPKPKSTEFRKWPVDSEAIRELATTEKLDVFTIKVVRTAVDAGD